MESEHLLKESVTIGIRMNESTDLSNSKMKKEKDSIVQLRNEFKAAIKDLRNDVRINETRKNKRTHLFSLFVLDAITYQTKVIFL